MDIGDMIKALRDGGRVRRKVWIDRDHYIAAYAHPNCSPLAPHIYRFAGDNSICSWHATHDDLFATDWEIVP